MPPSAFARVNYWLRLAARFALAVLFTQYAVAKFVGTQFIDAGGTLDKPVGDLSGFELTWVYFGYSKPFAFFVAGGQLAAAVLLAFDRTARLGAAVLLPITANIVLVNYGFNISAGTKRLSVVLLALNLYLVLCDLPAWKRVLWDDTRDDPARPRFLRRAVFPALRAAVLLAAAGGGWWLLTSLRDEYMGLTPVTGDWAVEAVAVGGRPATHPGPPGPGEWWLVCFEPAGHVSVRTDRGQVRGRYSLDPAAGTFELGFDPAPVPPADPRQLAALRGAADDIPEADLLKLIEAEKAAVWPVTVRGTYRREPDGRLVLAGDRGGEPVELTLRPFPRPKF